MVRNEERLYAIVKCRFVERKKHEELKRKFEERDKLNYICEEVKQQVGFDASIRVNTDDLGSNVSQDIPEDGMSGDVCKLKKSEEEASGACVELFL